MLRFCMYKYIFYILYVGRVIFNFFYYEEKSMSRRGEGGAGILSRLHAQGRVRHGAQSRDPGIMTWAEIKSQMLNRLSHPGAMFYSNIAIYIYRYIYISYWLCFSEEHWLIQWQNESYALKS